MKAFRSDGTRWFAPTASEVMDRWLAEPELQDWLRRTVVFHGQDLDERSTRQLIGALLRELAPKLGRCWICAAPWKLCQCGYRKARQH